MPAINWIPIHTFLLITTLTPGPNNQSCVSMNVQHGYNRSLWAVFGTAIRRFLSKPVINKIFNGIVSAVLLYNVADLIKLPDLIAKIFS